MTVGAVRRTFVAGALAAAAAASVMSGTTSTASNGIRLADQPICYIRSFPTGGTVNYCVPRTPLSQNGCAVNLGACDGGCTVNVGYCAPDGTCLVNTGECGDGSLISL